MILRSRKPLKRATLEVAKDDTEDENRTSDEKPKLEKNKSHSATEPASEGEAKHTIVVVRPIYSLIRSHIVRHLTTSVIWCWHADIIRPQDSRFTYPFSRVFGSNIDGDYHSDALTSSQKDSIIH